MIALHVGVAHAVEPLWSHWTADPSALVGVSLAGVLYVRGLMRSPGRRRRLHPRWRPVLFYTGLAIIVVALMSPLDALADELFFIHMAQHLLLVLAAPPLILLSAPMIPLLRGMPRPLRRRLVAPLTRWPAVRGGFRFLTLPLVGWGVYVVVFLGWHAPAPYDAALANEGIHILEHLTFSAAALLFWWNVIDPIPLRPNLPYLARLPYVFVTSVPNFSLGAFLVFASQPWYAFYQKGPLRFGLTPLEDQQIGGLLMWIPGAMVLLLALVILLAVMMVKEERRQREREARAR